MLLYLRSLLLWEHGALLAGGVLCGVVAALVAVLPALMSPGGRVPFASVFGMLVAVVVGGALWTRLATGAATRGDLLPALRNE